MSANNPPNPYFNNINFNSSYFSSISDFITLTYANTHYLLSYGNATSTATTTQFTGSVGIGATASGTAGDLKISSGTVSNNLYINGKVGMGTTSLPTSSTLINAYSTTYTLPRIALTGTEFYSGGLYTSTDGIAQIVGVNRSGNRQLWIGDTALLAVNTTNPVLKFAIGSTPTISASATDGGTALPLNLNNSITILANGNIGIGTASTTFKLDINATGGASGNAFRIFDYGNNNSGYITMNSGGVSGTNQCGFISFFQPTTQARAGYIGWGQSIGGANYLLLETEGTFSGYNVTGSLAVNGTIGQGLPNTDMNITTYGGNTTGGNMNISAIGASGNINLSTSGNIRFKIDPSGYNVSMTGSYSTLVTAVYAQTAGINGYWYIPIPYLNISTNYYNLAMLNMYNSDNASFWTGHIIINPITNQLSYVALSSGGFFTIQLALVYTSVWNIKISFSNNFPVTLAMALNYKYIG
jgi:hypothetical protein